MTEVERLRDKARVALLREAVAPEDMSRAEFLFGLASELEEASAKQDDEDRNGVRRAMGKADCAEPVKPD